MNADQLQYLEKTVGNLELALDGLADSDDLRQLLTFVHRPGWTTPAEFALVLGLVDVMVSAVAQIQHLKGLLMKGADLVGRH